MIRDHKAIVGDWIREGKDKTKQTQFENMVNTYDSFKGRENSIDTKIKTTKIRLSAINLSETER